GYVAPEQITAVSDIDGRADVYSLGCVLFECLTGTQPFPHDSDIAILFAHTRDPRPRVSERRADAPPLVDAVLARAMAIDRDERYPTTAALMRARPDAPPPARAAGATPDTRTAQTEPPPAPARTIPVSGDTQIAPTPLRAGPPTAPTLHAIEVPPTP